jgi:hypothetical protein
MSNEDKIIGKDLRLDQNWGAVTHEASMIPGGVRLREELHKEIKCLQQVSSNYSHSITYFYEFHKTLTNAQLEIVVQLKKRGGSLTPKLSFMDVDPRFADNHKTDRRRTFRNTLSWPK